METAQGSGTGVIFEMRGQTAYVLTAWHVIEGFGEVTVQVRDKDEYIGKVLGYDAWRDLAVVEICCGSFRTMQVQDHQSIIKPGADVIAIGYALGFEGPATVTRGIVSAYRYRDDYRSWVIQTDAPINPGNSGGPLLLANGEFVGINAFGYAQVAEGLGFAVSKQTIQGVISGLKTGTRVDFPTPTPLPTPTPFVKSWQTHVNRAYGYEINVPEGWTEEGKGTYLFSFQSPEQKATVLVQVYNAYFDSADTAMSDWLDERASGSPVVFEILGRTGNVAHASSYYRHQGSSQYCIEEFFDYMWLRGNRQFYLSLRACENSADKYIPVFNEIFDSLKWR